MDSSSGESGLDGSVPEEDGFLPPRPLPVQMLRHASEPVVKWKKQSLRSCAVRIEPQGLAWLRGIVATEHITEGPHPVFVPRKKKGGQADTL